MTNLGVFGDVTEENLELPELETAPNGFSNQIQINLGDDPPQTLAQPVMHGPLQAPLTQPQRTPDNRAYAFEPSPNNYMNWGPTPLQGMQGVDMSSGETVVPLIAVVGATVAGGVFFGIWGAGAGALLTGAAMNLYRSSAATPENRSWWPQNCRPTSERRARAAGQSHPVPERMSAPTSRSRA
jgi:hypothetical protein